MNQIKQVLLEGNIVKDPECKKINGGKDDYSLLVVGCTKSYKNHKGEIVDEVSYFHVEGWGDMARQMKNAKKGRDVRVVGQLKQNRWTDTTGKTHSKFIIVAESLEYKISFEQKKNKIRTKDDDYGRGM